MRALSFSLIAVLSCIAMISAAPAETIAPAEANVRRQTGIGGIGPIGPANSKYVPY